MRKYCVLLALLLAGGCSTPRQPSFSEKADTAADFGRLADEYITGYLAWRPLTGTALGLHQFDGRVTDFSKVSLDLELGRLKTFARRLEEIDPATLGRPAFYDYHILRNVINREIFGFEQAQIYSRNPMTYANALDVNTYIKRNFAPLDQRVRSIAAILEQAPKIIEAARANLAQELPRPLVETAIDEATGAADFLAKDLVQAVKGVTDEKLMAQFNAANQRAIDELRGYVAYLKDTKLPKANEDYHLGRDKYIKLLEYGEMVTLSPEDLLKIGFAELKRKQKVFAETARQIDPRKKPVEVFQAIQKDHPTEQSLIPDTAKNMEMIRQFLIDHYIVTLPSQVRPKVTETPQFLRATSFASMDTPGPFEKNAAEAYYYVTPVEPDWTPKQKEEWLTAFNYYTTDIVSTHEAYPGHYVQYLCLNASPATKLEKIFVGYAFSEGWAHYAEQMMVDEGFGNPPGWSQEREKAGLKTLSPEESLRAAKYKLAQTDEALLRVCRMCVSIQMHCQGMTVDEATKFFQDNCYYEQKPARAEAMRGAYDPEYLYYTLGKLEIFKLREDYRKEQGKRFTLQKFHDQMLRHGAPPIRLLREVMLKQRRAWPETLSEAAAKP